MHKEMIQPLRADRAKTAGEAVYLKGDDHKMEKKSSIADGYNVLPYLAKIYQQLYLVPGEESAKEYVKIVRSGKEAANKDLSHFRMDPSDSLTLEKTPAGEVRILTLHNRKDFEMFYTIVAHKCVPYQVPASLGASLLDGMINWEKINRHEQEWVAEQKKAGNPCPDVDAEFQRFTSDKKNYLDALIVLSYGPYSNISAQAAGFAPEEWLSLSGSIRKYHECTHFICRRLYREKIDPIWDELVADAEGIYETFGYMDVKLEELFLGINENGYDKGRLENYVKPEDDIQVIARTCHALLLKFEELSKNHERMEPYAFALLLEEKKEELQAMVSDIS